MSFRCQHFVTLSFIILVLAWAGPVHAVKPTGLLESLNRVRAVIETSRDICLVLDIYLADTPEQQAQGLMFIMEMDEFEGMLFRHARAGQFNMWMKNTYIPLDMVFIRNDGSIAGIAKLTEPLSTRRISSPANVLAVLELNGGFSDRWDIKPGNRLLTF
jgi:hypothetical protein